MKKILFALCAMSAFVACNRTQPEGPAERAGRHIDNTADEIHDDAVRTGQNAKSMGREIKNDVTPSDETIERTKENAREIGRDVKHRVTGDNS